MAARRGINRTTLEVSRTTPADHATVWLWPTDRVTLWRRPLHDGVVSPNARPRISRRSRPVHRFGDAPPSVAPVSPFGWRPGGPRPGVWVGPVPCGSGARRPWCLGPSPPGGSVRGARPCAAVSAPFCGPASLSPLGECGKEGEGRGTDPKDHHAAGRRTPGGRRQSYYRNTVTEGSGLTTFCRVIMGYC